MSQELDVGDAVLFGIGTWVESGIVVQDSAPTNKDRALIRYSNWDGRRRLTVTRHRNQIFKVSYEIYFRHLTDWLQPSAPVVMMRARILAEAGVPQEAFEDALQKVLQEVS